MAKKHRNEVAVGITVLVVLVLAVYIVVALADWSNLFARQQHITVQLPYQEGLKGLAAGSPIFLGGVKIGQITETDINPPAEGTEDVYVFFTMEIPASYRLRRDCVLSPQSNVLGGLASLAIKDLGRRGEINDGETVKLQLEGGITEAMDSIKQELNPDLPGSLMSRLKYEISRDHDDSFMKSLVNTIANIEDITAKIDEQVTMDEEKQSLVAKVHAAVDRLSDITQQINEELNEKEIETVAFKLHAALDSFNRSLDNIDKLIATNKPGITETVSALQLAAQKIGPALDKANSAMESAQAALDNLKDLTAVAKDTLVINRESVDSMVRNLHEVSVNIKMASREIRRAPWKLLYSPDEDELHVQGMIDAAGAFAAGAESLDEATLRLQALLAGTAEQVPLDKKLLDAVTAELEISFERFKAAEEKFWKEIK
ncbi:MAG: hypothetical protein AMJ79_12350 [Phycisphaerae bacterium SM23_30]|nr:MAG: hypothetical protein AMJ79_12350 [Phycisphaerae bacterium SM23_30]